MSIRETAHQLIDEVPDDQLAQVLEYLRQLQAADENGEANKTLAAAKIEEGYAAAQRGELIDSDEVRRRMEEKKSTWRNQRRRA